MPPPAIPVHRVSRIKPAPTLDTVLVEDVLEFEGVASDPSTLRNGMLWYNTTGNALKARINGATVSLGSGGGGGGSGTVTSVALSFTGGIVSVGGSPITGDGTLAMTIAGTSGGIPYFSSSTGWASSAALAANSLVKGGGAGAAPSTITTGTGVLTALGVNVGSSGAFVVNGGALGTPSGGTLTNCTGLPVGSITGLGTGVATFLATPTFANINTAVSDAELARTDAGNTFTGDQEISGALTLSDDTKTHPLYGNTFNFVTVYFNVTATATINLVPTTSWSLSTLNGMSVITGDNAGAVAVTATTFTLNGVAVVDATSAQTLEQKRITRRIETLTDAATVTPDCDNYDGGVLATVSQTTTIANPTGTPTDTQLYLLRIKSSAVRTLAFGTQFRGSTDLALPSATTGSSKTERHLFEWHAGDSKWDIIATIVGH